MASSSANFFAICIALLAMIVFFYNMYYFHVKLDTLNKPNGFEIKVNIFHVEASSFSIKLETFQQS